MSIKLPRRSASKPGRGRFTSGLVPVLEGRKINPACVYVAAWGADRSKVGYSANMRALKQRLRHLRATTKHRVELCHIAWVGNELFARRVAAHVQCMLGGAHQLVRSPGWYCIGSDSAWHCVCRALQELRVPYATHAEYLAHCVPEDDFELDRMFGAI
jgi:hypothetical protein